MSQNKTVQPITHYDASNAAEIAATTDLDKIFHAATSQHASSAVRFAVALNRHTDRWLLEGMIDDPAPHVAELVAARLEGMDKHERLLIGWSKSDEPGRDGDKLMDAEGVAIVRHLTKTNVENLTVDQCLAAVRQALIETPA